MSDPRPCGKCGQLPTICRIDRGKPLDNFVLWEARCGCGVTLHAASRDDVVVLWNLFRHAKASVEAKTVAKLLRAIAKGTNAKENGHDIIFNKAAELLDDYDGRIA